MSRRLTKVHEQKQAGTAAQVQVGDRIGIAGTEDGTQLQARRVRDHGVATTPERGATTAPPTPPATPPVTPQSGAPITPSGS